MLSKKEILEILDRLIENNNGEFLDTPFIYIENEMKLAMMKELKKSNVWSDEDHVFISQFIGKCRKMVHLKKYSGLGFYNTDYLKASFLNDTFFSLFNDLPNKEWSKYFEKNKGDAYFVLMSIKSFSFKHFDEIFKNIILTCQNDTLRIDLCQESPLFLQAFSNGYGYQALKKVKEVDLLSLFNNRKKLKYYSNMTFLSTKETNCFSSLLKWFNEILITQPYGDRIDFKMEESMSIDFIPRNENGELSLKSFSSVDGDIVLGSYAFVINKKIDDFTINDLDQFRRLKHLVQVLSLNSKIDYYFAINPSSGKSAYTSYLNNMKNTYFDSANDEKNDDKNKKIFYKKLRELEKEESSFIYKLKTLNSSKLNRYKDWSYPEYEEIFKAKNKVMNDFMGLKYKFNYTGFVLNNKCEVNILKNIDDFIDQNPEYYDEKKGALNEIGVELFFLNYLC